MTMFSKLTAVAVAMTLATAKKDKECTDGTQPTFCMDGATPTCDLTGLTAVLTDEKKEPWECQLNGEEVKDAEPECADASEPKYCQDGTEPVQVDDDEKKGADAGDDSSDDSSDDEKEAKAPECAEGETPTYCSDGGAPTCEQTVGGDVLTAVQDDKKEDKWRCEDSMGDKVTGTEPTCSDGSEPQASCKAPKTSKGAPGSEDDCKKDERTYCESGTLTACEKDSDPCVPVSMRRVSGSNPFAHLNGDQKGGRRLEEDPRRRPGGKGPKAENLCVDATGAVLGEPTCEPAADNTLPPPVAP